MVVEDRLDEMRDEGYCYIIVSKYSLELIYWIDHLFFYVSVIGLRFFFFRTLYFDHAMIRAV